MSKTETESKLTYRLKRLSEEERSELSGKLGIRSRAQWYRLQRQPGKFLDLDQSIILHRYLEELDEVEYNLFELLEPIALTS